MKNQKDSNDEKVKLLLLLDLQKMDHTSILECYDGQKMVYRNLLENAENIRERIKLQNQMIELDDAFLDYQASLGTFKW